MTKKQNSVFTSNKYADYEFTGPPPTKIQTDIEEAILGGILLDPYSIARCKQENLLPEHFTWPIHQSLYRAALHLDSENKPTDLMNMAVTMHSWGFDSRETQFKIAQLLERTVSAVNIDQHAQLLIDLNKRRNSIIPESPLERELRGIQVEMREILMDDKITDSERSVRLEALKEKHEITGQSFNNLLGPIRKETNSIKLKLELKALLQEHDPIEKFVKIKQVSDNYRLSQQSIESLLKTLRTETQTVQAKDLSLSELFNEESAPIDWLVPGLIPRGETILLISSPKCGKTLLSMDLAFCLATGEESFLGNKEFRTSSKKVLLISVDESKQSTKAKLFNRGFTSEDKNVRVILNWNINQIPMLEKVLEDFRPDLVIVDSLKRISHGSAISENSAEFADNIYTLKELFSSYGAAGILIHHSSKDKELEGVYRSRGSSAIAGAVWGVWQLDHIPKPDPDNPKKKIIDPNDPLRRFYAYSRDCAGESYILNFNPETCCFRTTSEGLTENEKIQIALSDDTKKLLKLNKNGLLGGQIVELLRLDEKSPPNEHLIYKVLNRLVAKQIIGIKRCPDNKRAKIYYMSDFQQQSINQAPENRGIP